MSAESLLETSWGERGRRSWTTLTSFGLQAVIVGLMLLVPLLTTVGLPPPRLNGPADGCAISLKSCSTGSRRWA